MSATKPPNVHAESKKELQTNLKKVEQRAAILSKELAAACYVDTIEEARFIFDLMRNDAHVMSLRNERNELEFLLRRAKDLANDIEHFGEAAE